MTDPITFVPGRTDFNPYSPLHDPWIVPTASSTFDFLADQSASTIAHPKRAGISPIAVNRRPPPVIRKPTLWRWQDYRPFLDRINPSTERSVSVASNVYRPIGTMAHVVRRP